MLTPYNKIPFLLQKCAANLSSTNFFILNSLIEIHFLFLNCFNCSIVFIYFVICLLIKKEWTEGEKVYLAVKTMSDSQQNLLLLYYYMYMF